MKGEQAEDFVDRNHGWRRRELRNRLGEQREPASTSIRDVATGGRATVAVAGVRGTLAAFGGGFVGGLKSGALAWDEENVRGEERDGEFELPVPEKEQ